MRLFVLSMKKNQHYIYLAVSMISLGIYVSYTEPGADRPLTLAGFSGLVFVSLFWAFYSLLKRFALGKVTYIVSFVVALSILYLIALSTLNSLGILDIAIVVASAGMLIAFVIGPLRRRRK